MIIIATFPPPNSPGSSPADGSFVTTVVLGGCVGDGVTAGGVTGVGVGVSIGGDVGVTAGVTVGDGVGGQVFGTWSSTRDASA